MPEVYPNTQPSLEEVAKSLIPESEKVFSSITEWNCTSYVNVLFHPNEDPTPFINAAKRAGMRVSAVIVSDPSDERVEEWASQLDEMGYSVSHVIEGLDTVRLKGEPVHPLIMERVREIESIIEYPGGKPGWDRTTIEEYAADLTKILGSKHYQPTEA